MAQPLDPPIAPEGIDIPIAPLCFSGIAWVARTDPLIQATNILRSGLSKRCFWQTVILPGAIFVIFVDFRGWRSKIPCFVGRMQYQHFRQFSSKPPVFGRGKKTTVFQNDLFDNPDKDVNSENSNYCPIWVRDFFWSSRRQNPEVWNFCVFTVFELLSRLPRNSRASLVAQALYPPLSRYRV